MFDFHTHTRNSLDSLQTADELCLSAIANGCRGIAITDHADMWFYAERDTLNRIRNSVADARKAAADYKGKLEVFSGVELSEYLDDRKNGDILLGLTDYDVILCSVHCVKTEDWEDAYSHIRFDESVSEQKITRFWQRYFEAMQEHADWGGFDVLAHLTCPLRYLVGKYGRTVDLTPFRPQIAAILETIIRKQIALELNSAWYFKSGGEMTPDEGILRLYRDLGGKLITLASDAHIPAHVGGGLRDAMALLRSLGYTHYYYYKKRVPQEVPLP